MEAVNRRVYQKLDEMQRAEQATQEARKKAFISQQIALKTTGWNRYKEYCAKEGLEPPTREEFLKQWDRLDEEKAKRRSWWSWKK
jgi:hypothetical protein